MMNDAKKMMIPFSKHEARALIEQANEKLGFEKDLTWD